MWTRHHKLLEDLPVWMKTEMRNKVGNGSHMENEWMNGQKDVWMNG